MQKAKYPSPKKYSRVYVLYDIQYGRVFMNYKAVENVIREYKLQNARIRMFDHIEDAYNSFMKYEKNYELAKMPKVDSANLVRKRSHRFNKELLRNMSVGKVMSNKSSHDNLSQPNHINSPQITYPALVISLSKTADPTAFPSALTNQSVITLSCYKLLSRTIPDTLLTQITQTVLEADILGIEYLFTIKMLKHCWECVKGEYDNISKIFCASANICSTISQGSGLSSYISTDHSIQREICEANELLQKNFDFVCFCRDILLYNPEVSFEIVDKPLSQLNQTVPPL